LEQGELRPASVSDIEAAAKLRVAYWQNSFRLLLADIADSTGEESWVKFADELKACVNGWDHSLPNLEILPTKPRRSKKQGPEFEPLHEASEKLLKSFKDEMNDPCWEPENWPRMA